MSKTYKYVKKEVLFFLAYFLLGLTHVVIANSYLFGANRFVINEIIQYIAAFIFILSFCVGKYKVKEFWLRLGAAIMLFLVTQRSHSIEFGLAALAVITCVNISSEKIVKNCIRNNIFFAVIVVVPALLGIIPNEVYVHEGMTAYSFGFAYYSNLPNLVFSIILAAYFLAKNKRKERIILLISVPVQITMYKLCTVRLTYYLYLIFLIVAIMTQFYDKRKKHKALIFIATVMYPVTCIVTIVASFLYQKSSILSKINVMLNYRLGFNAAGFSRYGINLFGTKLQSVSETWDSNYVNHYFYIDSGYVNSLISYGIIFFIVLLIGYSFLSRYAIKNNQIKLGGWCLIICIYSVINNWLFNVAINPLPMIAFNLMWNPRTRNEMSARVRKKKI